MANPVDMGRLRHIFNYCNETLIKLDNISLDDFCEEDELIELVKNCIVEIGEISEGFPEDLKLSIASIPWKQLIDLKDRIVQNIYVSDATLYHTAIDEFEELIIIIGNLLGNK